MLNRILCLLLAVIAPLAAGVAANIDSIYSADGASLADRTPAMLLAAMSVVLAVWHVLSAVRGTLPVRAIMWTGLAAYFATLAVKQPHISSWLIVAMLSLAATSLAVLLGDAKRSRQIAVQSHRAAYSH